MTRLLLVLALAACAKKSDDEPARPKAIAAEEVQRGQDACKAYVEKACACAAKVPSVKEQCDLARALPDALQLQLQYAQAAETKKNDVLAAQAAVRKVVKECIEETAKLPAAGCQ